MQKKFAFQNGKATFITYKVNFYKSDEICTFDQKLSAHSLLRRLCPAFVPSEPPGFSLI